MSAEEILRSTEQKALNPDHEIITHVNGKSFKKQGKLKSFSAMIFATVIILVFVIFFASGNLIPSAISERLIEETDVQYADAVESKMIIFQQTLSQGELPNNTIMRLKNAGVLVGSLEGDKFIEKSDGTMLKMGNEIITADNFISKVHSNTQLYDAFNNATYARAAYYYDDAAQEVFKEIGVSRNNYTDDSEFEEVMDKILGEGSDIDVNSVTLVEKEDKDGKKYYEYVTLGASASSEAEDFVTNVSKKSLAENNERATLSAASTLNAADKISVEQKSVRFYIAFMENISKMKAGDGNSSKINEAMSLLYKDIDSDVVDTETGEIITVKGSMIESPSLYAILSGEKIDPEKVGNYSSDRVLKTVENQLGVNDNKDTLSSTVTSTTKNVRGSIGRYITNGTTPASTDVLSKVTPTINQSLVNNSFKNIGGIAGGEFLVSGAVNTGKLLAKASGATTGDAMAVKSYARLTNTILAMDAKVDKMNRSPFDVTSKNTFLGAILYKFALVMQRNSSLLQHATTIAQVVGSSIASILPTTRADDESDAYLANFGNCETLESIGAVGSSTCASIVTFDTSTLNGIFDDPNFIKFIEENTILKDGVRTIKSGSYLADFIIYNDKRSTPDGLTDGGIIKSLRNDASSIQFASDILDMVETWKGSSQNEQRIASGAAFVNSDDNADWDAYYKYAQRYVSLARATAALRQYDGEETSYTNIKYFEGNENPVLAFINEYQKLANK